MQTEPSAPALAAYGALGWPLAFVALPLYVQLPPHYATQFGVPLATLGALLLAARALDALADPWIGRWCDAWLSRRPAHAAWVMSIAALLLAVGFHGLFFPAVRDLPALLVWCSAMLVLTYLAYSVLSVAHQAWGARLGGGEARRSRVTSWREGLALAGVLAATVLPAVAGFGVTSMVFAVTLAVALTLLWASAPRPEPGMQRSEPLLTPWHNPAFRRLLAIYLVNGVAAAVPATLVLFFVRDRLQAPAFEPLFLAAYFAAGALAMPLWLRLVARHGIARSWLLGMGLAVLAFAGVPWLQAGDVTAFTVICVASGAALGADLALPGALLAGVVQRAGHAGRLEGNYFGWWNGAAKLNLALAAGLALPMLQLAGYAPGQRDAQALQALALTYAVLPCALKTLAALMLYRWCVRAPASPRQAFT